MGWKKIFSDIKMPDKNDPKYKERYEREVAAGEKFARVTGISKTVAYLQSVGERHKKAFVLTVFGIVVFLFLLNMYHLVSSFSHSGNNAVAIERMEKALREHNRIR
jgi:hypothetical protein